MKFDVIIGNPPYQMLDGGFNKSAKPLYHKFVEQAIKLQPRYLTMIIPARWFAGGKGLNKFRQNMLNDKSIRKLVDYENANELFSGVDVAGGICYFLWEKDNQGLCETTNFINGKAETSPRYLNEYPIYIRHSKALPIIKKVAKAEEKKEFLDKVVSSRKPFGLSTNYNPTKEGIPCYFTQKIGFQFADQKDVSDNYKILDKWKLLIPRAPIAGQTDFSKPVGFYYDGNTRIVKPGEICTETYLVACAFKTEQEVIFFKSYLFTKIVRFLILQTVVSQHVTKSNFLFVPHLGFYNELFSDDLLRERWGITQDEWDYIDSRIKTKYVSPSINFKNKQNEI